MAYVQKDHLNNDKNKNLVRNARQASQHHEPDFEVVPRGHRLFCASGEQRDESARAADAETVVDCWRRALKKEIVKEMFTHRIRNISINQPIYRQSRGFCCCGGGGFFVIS